MKKLNFLKITVVFFISIFSINETNAQCKPNAGVDTATCGITYSLDAIPQNTGATAQWTVYTKPAGSSVVFGDGTAGADQVFNVDVLVNEYGVYEFVIEETFATCTDYDTILIEFIRTPVIFAGDDQYICGWRAQMEAIMDPNSQAGSWDSISSYNFYWTDQAWADTTDYTEIPIEIDWTQRQNPNAVVTFPIPEHYCVDSVMMIWQEYSVGSIFNNHQCYSEDTVMLYFHADIQAENNTVIIEPEICGREIQLTNSQDIYCATGYWIDSLSIVIDWDPSNSTPNTTATVGNYGTDAFAYVIENGHVPGSNYPVCSDTSDFTTVSFIQKPEVDACPGCYRLENAVTSHGDYVGSVRTDTVCFNDYSDFYVLNPSMNLGQGSWSKASSGIILLNGNFGSGNISNEINDTVYAVIFNSAGIPNNDYYTLVFISTNSPNGCEGRDTLLLSIAKNPSAEIGFVNPYFHNQSAKVWAEEDNEANPTVFNWTFNDNPIFDSVVVSNPDSIYYPRWNQTDCNELLHGVELQTSSDWGCYSQINTDTIEDMATVMPLTNNTQPTTGMNDGVIRLLTDSMVDCDGSFQLLYSHCWISSTLQEDLANNIPNFDNQINFGADCDIDSIYGLRVEDTCILVIQYSAIIDTVTTKIIYTDTVMLQVGNNTVVENIDLNQDIKIYPNPAKEQLTISGLSDLDINRIDIFDINGKLIKETSEIEKLGEININISDLDEGIYFIKIGRYIGKFVKLK